MRAAALSSLFGFSAAFVCALGLASGCNTESAPRAASPSVALVSTDAGTPSQTIGALADLDAGTTTLASPTMQVESAASLLERWNEAHRRHDTDALTQLYARDVSFYGQKLGGSECVARKARAFAKAPDYTQSVADASFIRDGNGGTYVELKKTWTANGKTTSAPAYVYFNDQHVIAEGDGASTPSVRWDWCAVETPLELRLPSSKAMGDYLVSPLEAIESADRSEHVKDVATRAHASHVNVVINPAAAADACPYLCSGREDSPCAAKPCDGKTGRCAAFRLSIENADTSKILGDLEVDAMTKILYWQSPSGLASEPPSPIR